MSDLGLKEILCKRTHTCMHTKHTDKWGDSKDLKGLKYMIKLYICLHTCLIESSQGISIYTCTGKQTFIHEYTYVQIMIYNTET